MIWPVRVARRDAGSWGAIARALFVLAFVSAVAACGASPEGPLGSSRPVVRETSSTDSPPPALEAPPERIVSAPSAGAANAPVPTIAHRSSMSRVPDPGGGDADEPSARGSSGGTPRSDPRMPRRDLSEDEARGGHTLERHVGKTDEELRARLSRERQISAASTYTDRAVAETTVALALAEQSRRVKAWSDKRGGRPNLALDYHGPPGTAIGRTIRRGQRRSDACTDAVIVLRWDTRRDDYYVLTSYPERRR